ncbi:MAG: OmpH family outer membrane protein [Bdellovibrionales bacterium]|nr:OmpH family outer membrane protein [Bdellovibrionales bacterium]
MKLLFCCLTLFASSASADIKIAVFDMETAIQATSDGKTAKANLVKEFKFLEGKLKKREFGLREKIKEFDKKALILSDKKRVEQQQELQKLSINFQKDMQNFQVEFQKKQIAATKPIIEKLQSEIAKLASQKDFDVVLNKSVDNVLWSKKAIDITDTVVKLYEESKS